MTQADHPRNEVRAPAVTDALTWCSAAAEAHSSLLSARVPVQDPVTTGDARKIVERRGLQVGIGYDG